MPWRVVGAAASFVRRLVEAGPRLNALVCGVRLSKMSRDVFICASNFVEEVRAVWWFAKAARNER